MNLGGRELNPRERILGNVTVLVLLGALGYRFVYSPVRERIAGAGEPAADIAAFERLAADLENAQSLEQSIFAYKEKHFGSPAAKLAAANDIRSVMAHLEELAGKSGIAFTSWTPSPIDRTSEIPRVDVKLEGAGEYPAVVKYLYALEHADYIVQPVSLNISGGKDLKVALEVRIFIQPEQPRGRRVYPGVT